MKSGLDAKPLFLQVDMLRIFFNQKTNVSRLESHIYELNIKDILLFLNQVKLSKQNLVLSSSLDKSSGKCYSSKFSYYK